MTVLEWSGEIGWDLWPSMVRAQLKASKGDDLTIRFSSLGGSIFDGSDIFNMLADHRRDNPKITMNLEIKATAASMGSAIAASPVWDEITVEPTSIYMIHNPMSIAFGDFKRMEKMTAFLKGLRDIWGKVYALKSDSSITNINEMMEVETNFFGKEIVDAGFADKMNEPAQGSNEDPQAKIIAIETMRAKFQNMKKRQEELSEGEEFDEKRAAVCLGFKEKVKMQKTVKIDGDLNKNIKPAQSGKRTEDIMDKAELKKDNPAVYNDTVQDGVKIERERVKELTTMKTKDEYKDIPAVLAVIDTAISEGLEVEQVNPLIMAAILKIQNDPAQAQAASDESPGAIQGGDQKTSVMQKKRIREV